MKSRIKLTFPVAATLTALVAIGAYWPSLDGGFVFDDTEAIVNNADVLPSTPYAVLFANDFWGRSVVSNRSHKSYRPLTVLTFRFNYFLSGGLHPWGFHLFNIVLHAAVCIVLLCVFCVLIGGKLQWNTCPPVVLYAGLLFAVLPVHTENVAGIVGRADMLCAFFYFVAFIVYSKLRTLTLKSSCKPQRLVIWLFVFSFLTTISMLCKEQGITILGLCLVYDFLLSTRGILKNNIQTNIYNGLNRSFLLHFCFLSLLGLALFLARLWIMGCSLPVFQEVDNPSSFAKSWLQRLANYNYIYGINAWLLLFPQWLCFDWSMGCIPLIENISDVRLLAVFSFWGVFLALLYACVRDWVQKYSRSLPMAVVFIIVPFLPASNLLVSVGFVLAERVLYISSAGFCLLIALGLQRIYLTLHQHNIVPFIAGLCICVFYLRCSQRSMDWLTEKSLFMSALSVCPLNAKVHYNIAKNAGDAGNDSLAIEKYREALRLHPEYDRAMNNLANILKDLGQLEEAEKLLEKAVQIRLTFAAAWMNLGIVQASLDKHQQAEQSYLKAIFHRQRFPDCYYNLGNLYLAQKLYMKAYEAWLKAIQQKPTHAVSWNNMIIMFDNIGDLAKAKTIGQDAILVLPNDASIHFNLANVLGKLGEFEQSEKHFMKAILENNNNPTYFANLGVLYHRWKKYPEAENAYRQALQLNSSAQSARDNLNLLLQKMRFGNPDVS